MHTVAGSCKVLEVLFVPPGGYNVPYLKSCLLQAKAYIRPIQKQLSLEPLSTNDDNSDESMTFVISDIYTKMQNCGTNSSQHCIDLHSDFPCGIPCHVNF